MKKSELRKIIKEELLKENTKEYDVLQSIRQKLTPLSSTASTLTRSKNKELANTAKKVEVELDKIRRMIFDFYMDEWDAK